jgi:hypothetical protein
VAHQNEQGGAGETRVVCNARGHSRKGEADHYNGLLTVEA